jgi:hypothetical protein
MVITCKTLSYSARVHSIALVLAGGDRLRGLRDAGACVYKSSWGINSSGAERKDIGESCP